MSWTLLGFLGLALLTLLGAWLVVTVDNVTHAAIALVASFVGVAGLFALLEAPFLAAVQVLIYAGAIMTVLIFAIMLSEVPEITGRREGPAYRYWISPHWGLAPAALGAVLAGMVLFAFGRTSWRIALPEQPGNSALALGQALFTTYVVPFEVASVLLLAAMVGAIIVSRQEDRR